MTPPPERDQKNDATRTLIAKDQCGAAIPKELRDCPQWIAWWSIVGEGRRVQLPNGGSTSLLKAQAKAHKLPIDPQTGGLASSTRPETWSSFEKACSSASKWSLTGIGFVFSDTDEYSGVDFDNCRNSETGEIADWAWEIIRRLDSYTEVSPSGTGVHIIVRGRLPEKKGNQTALQGGKVEMFSRARYFTFTGIHVEGTPTAIYDRQHELLLLHSELFGSRNIPETITDSIAHHPPPATDEELITKARQAENGQRFERLWGGDWTDYPSQSEADLALCCILAFWTGKDLKWMDDLFRRSSLMREKWLRKDYREDTLNKAIAFTHETWNRHVPSRSNAHIDGSGLSHQPPKIPIGRTHWNQKRSMGLQETL